MSDKQIALLMFTVGAAWGASTLAILLRAFGQLA